MEQYEADAITDEENTHSTKKEYMEYLMEQEDDTISNHTYKLEQELLEIIKSGDVERVKENDRNNIFPDYPQLLNVYEKKNEEYMAVITVALAARAVIQAGISSSESFQISDVYLKKIARASDMESIRRVRAEALVTYAELVRARKKAGKAGLYAEECKRYIAAHIFKRITIKNVADALNVNAIYLERVFKESEGSTVGQYIRREKVGRAKNLLVYSDRSVMEIGEYLGFLSNSHFGQVFKKETGMTPKQYRLANRISGF